MENMRKNDPELEQDPEIQEPVSRGKAYQAELQQLQSQDKAPGLFGGVIAAQPGERPPPQIDFTTGSSLPGGVFNSQKPAEKNGQSTFNSKQTSVPRGDRHPQDDEESSASEQPRKTSQLFPSTRKIVSLPVRGVRLPASKAIK